LTQPQLLNLLHLLNLLLSLLFLFVIPEGDLLLLLRLRLCLLLPLLLVIPEGDLVFAFLELKTHKFNDLSAPLCKNNSKLTCQAPRPQNRHRKIQQLTQNE